ncbi:MULTISPECIES: phosphoribosyltransferase [unclassified Thioalkalivibrio]|uniref:phosphoribosyltransferase n=1 Tax=unclassified Thioalkalivibrio TaxID=2621013 RepID=UPI00037CE866|nr:MULTISPECIES: phosphoribosyltransferase [unclassified Thioalkalivibrio]
MPEPNKMPVQLITVDEVVRAADDLAHQVLDSGFQPDCIVAIARGGFMPARFLCDFLRVHKLLSLKVEHYTSGAREKQQAAVTIPLAGDVRGERVLLVDDVNDSGDTLATARPHLEGFQPAAVRTAVLHEKAGTSCRADFHSQAVQEWRWILYPWAVIEDVGQFAREMDPAPNSPADLHARLQQDYGLALSTAELDRVIRYNRLDY